MFIKATASITFACFIVTLYGCFSQQDIPRESLPFMESRISQIVTTQGELISFRPDMHGNYAVLVDSMIVGVRATNGEVSIPLSEVSRITVERFDAGKTVLAVVGGAAVIALVALATKESCPFVYSYDGTQYVFDGEPYGGAICEGLKRTDWCRLEHLKPASGEYRLLLTNEVDETQFTDEFKLWVVDHRPGLEVMADAEGELHTIDKPAPPVQAMDGKKGDILKWVAAQDPLCWETDLLSRDPARAADWRDTLYLSFLRPEEKQTGKLVVGGSTTLWGSQMLKRMTELRGVETNNWFDMLRSPSMRQILDAWNGREELYRLQVKVRVANKWVTRGEISGGGPFITEDRIVVLDLSGVMGDTLQILLAPPAGFWQIDRLAMEYGKDEHINIQEISASRALGHDGADLLGTLDSTDGRYYMTPEVGQTATLTFRVPPQNAGLERAVFAKVSGYYSMHMNTNRPPQTGLLNRISFEHGFPVRFSLEEFVKWRTGQLKSLQGVRDGGR